MDEHRDSSNVAAALVVSCGTCRIAPDQRQGLRCRISGGVVVEASCDDEHGVVTCVVPSVRTLDAAASSQAMLSALSPPLCEAGALVLRQASSTRRQPTYALPDRRTQFPALATRSSMEMAMSCARAPTPACALLCTSPLLRCACVPARVDQPVAVWCTLGGPYCPPPLSSTQLLDAPMHVRAVERASF
jgi:hypothetical protein